MKDAHGYQLTGCNGQAQALLDQALEQFRCLRTASLASTEAALEASPELVMGHVLNAWLYLLGTEAAGIPVAQASLNQARALPQNDREARHIQALQLLIDGRWHAWIDYDKFTALANSGEAFSALDYCQPTPPWAVYDESAPDGGFDPEEQRFVRKGGQQAVTGGGC